MRVVYLSSSLALAALELLVHIDYGLALREHVAIPVDFDKNLLLQLDSDSLPADWQASDMLSVTQEVGDTWISRGNSALLAVPSREIPAEQYYLLNPQHPDARRVRVGVSQPFRYNPRLLKGRER